MAYLDDMKYKNLVDLVRKEWNQLETMVIEWNEVLAAAEERASKAYVKLNL